MYTLDTNTNTAIERQADWVRAVQAYDSHSDSQSAASSWTNEHTGHRSAASARAALALGASAPVALIVVWVLLAP
jgi:hypothetical protein